MKMLLQNRIWLALLLSSSLALLFISNCTTERGSEGPTTSTTASSNDGGSSGSDNTLSCDLIEQCTGNKCQCSGSDCCKDDEDCQDKCKDPLSSDGLKLSGAARDTCFHLEEDMVTKLFNLIDDLDKPKVERLREIGQDTDDMNLICSAVKELDYDLLDDRIENYSTTEAKRVLGWAAESDTAVEIFENAEDDKGLPMFQKLLQKASGGSGDQGVLDGLTKEVIVEDDDDDNQHIMRWALNGSKHKLVRWIHNEIITDKDEGLCGDDNKSNRPTSGTDAHDDDYAEAACILGVYCKIAPNDDSEDNDFRQEMAELIDSEVEVSDFIKEDASEGGLKPTNPPANWDDLADDWANKACAELKTEWDNGALDLDLS